MANPMAATLVSSSLETVRVALSRQQLGRGNLVDDAAEILFVPRRRYLNAVERLDWGYRNGGLVPGVDPARKRLSPIPTSPDPKAL
jgi:hypothetical protein